MTRYVGAVPVLAAHADFHRVAQTGVWEVQIAFPGGLSAVQILHVGAVEAAAGVVRAHGAAGDGGAPAGVCGVVYVSVVQGVAQVGNRPYDPTVPGQPLYFIFLFAHHVLSGQLGGHNLVVGEPSGRLLQNVVRCVQGVVLAVAGQYPVLGGHRVEVLPPKGVFGRRVVRHVQKGAAQRVDGVVFVLEIALQLAGLGAADAVHPRLARSLVVVVGVVVRQSINDAQLLAAVPGFGAAACVLRGEGRQEGFALQRPVVGKQLRGGCAFRGSGLKHLEGSRNAGGQGARAVVHAQPIQLAALVVQALAARGDGVVATGKAEFVEFFAREVLGIHLNDPAGKLTRQFGRGGLHNHQILQQGGREDVKRKGLAVRFRRGQGRSVQVGRVVAVVQTAHNRKFVVLDRRPRHALEHVARVAVRRAANALGRDSVGHAGQIFLLHQQRRGIFLGGGSRDGHHVQGGGVCFRQRHGQALNLSGLDSYVGQGFVFVAVVGKQQFVRSCGQRQREISVKVGQGAHAQAVHRNFDAG